MPRFSPEVADSQMASLVAKYDPFQETDPAFFAVQYMKNQNRIQSPAATWAFVFFQTEKAAIQSCLVS